MTRRRWGAVVTALALVLTPLSLLAAPAGTAPASAEAERPNVLFILTDDMRLDELRYMPFTRRLFRKQGTEFTHALSPHPLCCPARAELLTGQYAQNNGVRTNSGEHGGWERLKGESNLIFNWFHEEGYRTGFIGKLMNGYRGDDEPIVGLENNDATIRRVYHAKRVVTYNNGDPTVRRGHQLDYLTRRTRLLIRRFADEPFFIWTGIVAPHAMYQNGHWVPPIPPPGYDRFRKRSHRRPPSFDKPSFNAPNGDLPKVSRKAVRRHHRGRVLSLYAADDRMKKIVKTLQRQGVYDDTILVFSSDNGMGLGANRVFSKNQPYQDVVRVPLLMRGPGIPAGEKVDEVTTLVDLPATLAQMTGVTPGRVLDGGSLFDQPDNRAVLIQAGSKDGGWAWRGVYTQRYTFVDRKSSGRTETYDRANDPYERQSLQHPPAGMPALLTQLETCVGPTCAATY